MNVSRHALQQWNLRFPGADLTEAFTSARRPGAGVRRALRKQLPSRSVYLRRDRFQGRYYLVNRKLRAVFVCAPPEFVITVFPLTGNAEWLASRCSMHSIAHTFTNSKGQTA